MARRSLRGGEAARVFFLLRTDAHAIPPSEPAEGLFPPLRSARRVLGRNGATRAAKKVRKPVGKKTCPHQPSWPRRRRGPYGAQRGTGAAAQLTSTNASPVLVDVRWGFPQWLV